MNHKLTLLALAALTTTTLAIASSNPHHVPGESLDAGFSPAPSHVLNRVPGEKQDAMVDANFTWYRVAGEKRDSGLGDVTAEEMRRYVEAYGPTKLASK